MPVLTSVLMPAVVALGVAAPLSGKKVVPELPEPTGRHPVGVVDLENRDGNRKDPWHPAEARRLMLHVWYPAADETSGSPRAWFPGRQSALVTSMLAARMGVAPRDMDIAAAMTHARTDAAVDTGRKWPVVLYSSGKGFSGSMGTALVEDLASRGYIVVTIDHTYETDVEFPDGTLELADAKARQRTPDAHAQALATRVTDVDRLVDDLPQAVLDGLNAGRGTAVQTALARTMDTGAIGMFGQSYGGFTAFEAMAANHKIRAAANLDGQLAAWPSDLTDKNAKGPYTPGRSAVSGAGKGAALLLVREGHELGTDRSIDSFWKTHQGWRKEYVLHGAGHNGFTDYQVLGGQAVEKAGAARDRAEPSIGTIPELKSIAAQRAVLAAFFELHLYKHGNGHMPPLRKLHPELTEAGAGAQAR